MDLSVQGSRPSSSSNSSKRKSHLPPKIFDCVFCEKGFRWKWHLELHMHKHTGERPYDCPECDLWFQSSSSRALHRQDVHQGIRYQCDTCSADFSQLGNLFTHRTNIHGKTATKEQRKMLRKYNSFVSTEVDEVNKITTVKKVSKVKRVTKEKKAILAKKVTKRTHARPSVIKHTSTASNITGRNSNGKIDKATDLSARYNGINIYTILQRHNDLVQARKSERQAAHDASFFLHMNRYAPDSQ